MGKKYNKHNLRRNIKSRMKLEGYYWYRDTEERMKRPDETVVAKLKITDELLNYLWEHKLEAWNVDHKKPRKGKKSWIRGTNHLNNLQAFQCKENSRKGNKYPKQSKYPYKYKVYKAAKNIVGPEIKDLSTKLSWDEN